MKIIKIKRKGKIIKRVFVGLFDCADLFIEVPEFYDDNEIEKIVKKLVKKLY